MKFKVFLLLVLFFTSLTVQAIIRKDMYKYFDTEFSVRNVQNDMGEPIAIVYSVPGQEVKHVLSTGKSVLEIPIKLDIVANNKWISRPIDFYENSQEDEPDQVVRLFVSKEKVVGLDPTKQIKKIHVLMALVDLTQENEPIIQVIDEIKKDYLESNQGNDFFKIDVLLDGQGFQESGVTLSKQL